MNIEKWVSSLIWALLLVALVLTSIQAFTFMIGLEVYNITLTNLNRSPDVPDDDLKASEVFTLLLNVLSSLFLVMAWLNFASLSTYLIKALALDESPFASFLILPLETEEKEDLSLATGTTVSNVVRFLAFTWGILIVSPALIKVLTEIVGE